MDNFDFEDKPAKRPGPRLNLWDMLSVLVLLATLGIGAYFVFVFVNPATALNPLPPRIPTPFLFPTATITPLQLAPTWTPTFINQTDTPTLAPTITLEPSATGFSLVPPSKTPQPTETPKAPFSSTAPQAIESTIIHPDLGCNWLGVGGTVVDADGSPILPGPVVRLIGTLNGKPIGPGNTMTTVAGVNPEYGRSGFEFKLGDTPVASTSPLTLQLLDQAGLPLANNVYITTYNDCKKNLILVRFKKNP
jgi:hypothetical protein